jgi:predicted nucleic acid-binding protein
MSSRVLVDSSAWADYLRGRGRNGVEVLRLLAEDRVILHPTVVGEVLLGGVDLSDGRIGEVPSLAAFPAELVVGWLRRRSPPSLRGIGWADCVIAHAALMSNTDLLTSDEGQRLLYDAHR